MQRRASMAHWIGVVAILFSLLTPLFALDAGAEDTLSDPEVSLSSGNGTPEPTVPAPLPTLEPTIPPTLAPTLEPTAAPTIPPTVEPTVPAPEPTRAPTIAPTIEPTAEPTVAPTIPPTIESTPQPTETPIIVPTATEAASTLDEPASRMQPASTGGLQLRVEGANGAYPKGQAAVLTVIIENTGSTPVNGGTLKMTGFLRAGFRWNYTPNGLNCTYSTEMFGQVWNQDCRFGSLAPGESVTGTLRASTSGVPCGGHDVVDFYLNNSMTVSVHPQVSCEPDMTFTAVPDSASVDENAGFTFTFINTGYGDITKIEMLVPEIPESWTVDSITGTDLCVLSSAGLGCTFLPGYTTAMPLATGKSIKIHVSGTAPVCGAYTINPYADWSLGDRVSATASIEARCPDVGIAVDGPDTVAPGDDLWYTTTVTNSGTGAADDVSFEMYPPLFNNGTTWDIETDPAYPDMTCEWKGLTYLCSGLTLAPGASASVKVTAPTPRDATCGSTYGGGAELRGSYTGSGYIENDVICEPELELSIDGPDSIMPGESLSYTFTITNNGTAPAPEAEMRITMPSIGQTWHYDHPDGGCGLSGEENQVASCGSYATGKSPTVDVGESIRVTVTSYLPEKKALCDTTLSVDAYLRAGGTGSDLLKTRITCEPDVVVSIDGSTSIMMGDALSYEVVVRNDGLGIAEDVSFEMYLPGFDADTAWQVTPDEHQPDMTCLRANDTYTCSGITLESGASAIVAFAATSPENPAICGLPHEGHAELRGDYTGRTKPVKTEVVCGPILDVTIDGPDTIGPGEDLSYIVTIENTGDRPAEEAGARISIPGTDWAMSDKDKYLGCGTSRYANQVHVTCGMTVDQPTLDPGERLSFVVSGQIDADGALCDTSRNVTASITKGGTGSMSLTTDIVCIPNIAISMTGTEIASPGDQLSYKITVANTGYAPATGVGVAGQLPDIVKDWVLAENTPTGCAINGTVLACEDLEIAAETGEAVITVAGTVGTDPRVCGEVTASVAIAGNDASKKSIGTRVDCQPKMVLDTTVTAVQPAGGAPQSVPPDTDVTDLEPGDVVTYRLVTTNDGDVNLTNVAIADADADLESCAAVDVLAPDATAECTATHTVTEADILAGSFTNTATATSDQTDEVAASVTVYMSVPAPEISLTATITQLNGKPVTGPVEALVPGDVVSYEATATNIGNLSLSDVAISSDSNGVEADGCDPVELARGEDMTCSSTVEISQQVFDASADREVDVVAAVMATDPRDEVLANSAIITFGLAPAVPALDVDASVATESVDAPRDVVVTLTLVNSGNITLDQVNLPDQSRLDTAQVTCGEGGEGEPGVIPSLGTGQSITCTVPLDITQEDIDAGGDIVAAIRAMAETRAFGSVSNNATVTLGVVQVPDVQIGKTTEDRAYNLDPGASVTWQVAISNIGNVTMHGMSVTDERGTVSCPAGEEIAPGETRTCTVAQVVTEADLIAGEVPSTTTVTAFTPGGEAIIRWVSSMLTTVTPQSSLAIVQSAGIVRHGEPVTNAPARIGDEVTLSVDIRNTGNITIRDVTVTSSLPGLDVAGAGPARHGIMTFFRQDERDASGIDIAPGESRTWTTSYVVTADDVTSGSVTVMSTASGSGHDGSVTVEAERLVIAISQPDPYPTPEPASTPPSPSTPAPAYPSTPESVSAGGTATPAVSRPVNSGATPGASTLESIATPVAPKISGLPSTGTPGTPDAAIVWWLLAMTGGFLVVVGIVLRKRAR